MSRTAVTAIATKRRVRVVAALLHRGGRVLVQQRPAHKARGLLWEFPGGKVEAGEGDVAALRRECVEELGVEIECGRVLRTTVHDYEDLTVELVLIAARMPPEVEPHAHDAARLDWVRVADLAALPFCDADLEIVRDLAAGLIAF